MGKIIYHRDIKDQVIILDKEIDYSYYRETLIYCITNSKNKTEWMQVIHIGYRNRKTVISIQRCQRKIRSSEKIRNRYWILRNHWYGFQASDQFRYLLFNSVK
jgi:hypothetical protein